MKPVTALCWCEACDCPIIIGVKQSYSTAPPLRVYHSLRLRLPLLIGALILVVLGAFLWAFERQLERTVLRTGSERALVAAGQMANLVNQSALRGASEVHRLAADEAVRSYMLTPTAQTRSIVEQRLKPLAAAGQPAVELLDATGAVVLRVDTTPGSAAAPATGPALRGTPSSLGIGAFHLVEGAVVFEVADEVLASSADAGTAPAHRLGFLVVPRTMRAAQNADAIGRLVGAGATVAIGNRSGDVWTNFSVPVPGPRVATGRAGVAEYRAADGSWRIGGQSFVDGTPWTVWVDFPRELVLAAARAGFRQLLLLAAGFVMLAAFGVAILSARITKPLHALTQASEAIAAGDYARRLVIRRRDEIGRLGAAFNAMTAQVEHARQGLEQRVRERTRSLEESSDLLRARIQELKEAREELSQFFALSLDMLCIAGMDGRFKQVNGAWQRTLGWTAEDLTGRPYLEFVHPDDRASTAAQAERQAAGQAAMSFENRYRCKNGSYRWLSWNAAPLPSRGLIFAAARDVTDEKRTAKELERRAQELTAVNHELEAFSYSVSHDLRAPLRHITGFAELVRGSASASLSADSRRHLDTIVDAATHMGRLIDDLLAFSRVGRAELSRLRVDLNVLVRDVQQEIMAGVNGRDVVWRLHPLPVVDADRALLRLVLVNLLSNAVKYSSTRTRSEIDVGTMPGDGEEAVVYVRDNGVGFDMAYVDKLFGVFQRLHRDDEFEGIGIGLANVRRIVQRHGGRAWAEGAVDGGATMYFSLPHSGGVPDGRD